MRARHCNDKVSQSFNHRRKRAFVSQLVRPGYLKEELERKGQQVVIDLEAVRKGSGKDVTSKIDFLVDMAKAEALDSLGEQKAAVALAERYL